MEDFEKKYKEAMKACKELSDAFDNETLTEELEKIFPELCESEDEKIRKKIIAVIDACLNIRPQLIEEVDYLQIKAWLEKQGNFMGALQEANRKIGELVEENYYLKEQGEQKPGEKPVWYDNMDDLIADGMIDEIQKSDLPEGSKHNRIYWINKHRVQPKQEWKQENTDDLTDFENAMMHIGNSFFGQHAGLDPNDTNAIKEQANALLEFVSKQEWSEEDMEMIDLLIAIFRVSYPDEVYKANPIDTIDMKSVSSSEIIDWLKSLSPQNRWEPSDE